MGESTCAVLNCGRKVIARGWCRGHYDRWHQYGDVDPDRPLKKTKGVAGSGPCPIDGCTSLIRTSGLCNAHYLRRLRNGDPNVTRRHKRGICADDGCARPAYGHGVCSMHWLRLRRSDGIAIAGRIHRCTATQCGLPAVARGYCRFHYERFRRFGVALGRPTYTACEVPGCTTPLDRPHRPVCAAHRRRLRLWGSLERRCGSCGNVLPVVLAGGRIDRRFCDACKLQRGRARARQTFHRRRAAKAGAGSEKFSSLDVFARDRWRCGLCRRKVNQRLTYPHPKSASLDHKVPLASGGSHTRANTQLAHLRCNHRKRDRGEPEQLLLFG
jgi:hypothetical protein